MHTHDADPRRSRRQVIGLDVLRFAAALLVVGYHLGFIIWAPSNPARQLIKVDPVAPTSPPVFWFGFIGVQVFFVISGFVIAYSAERSHPAAFIRDRLVRLGPALWICATLSLILFLSFNPGEAVPIFKRYLREVAFYPRGPWLDPVVWTLGIEIVFYGLVLILLVIGRFRWMGALAAALTCASLAYNVIVASVNCNATEAFTACALLVNTERMKQLALLQHGSYFALGIFLWLHLIKRRPLREFWWMPLAVVSCILEIMGVVAEEERLGAHIGYRGDLPDALPIAIWLGAIAAVVASVLMNERLVRRTSSRLTAIVRYIGLSTYPLYLVHYVSLGPIILLLLYMGADVRLALCTSGIVVIALSAAIAVSLEPMLQSKMRAALNTVGRHLSLRGWKLRSRPGQEARIEERQMRSIQLVERQPP